MKQSLQISDLHPQAAASSGAVVEAPADGSEKKEDVEKKGIKLKDLLSWPVEKTPAASKKVILFGKAGDGKSSVANMLLNDTLEGPFPVSDDLHLQINNDLDERSADSWTVVEAPGYVAQSYTTSTKDKLTQIAEEKETVAVCFIKKNGQFSVIDGQCWKLFLEIFKSQKRKVLLVFTNSTEEWVQENHSAINSIYGTRYRRVAVDFAPTHTIEEVESHLNRHRKKSKKNITEEIQKLQECAERSGSQEDICLPHFLNWKSGAQKISSFIAG